MFNLSLRDEWVNNKKFCHRLSDDEDEDSEATESSSHGSGRGMATEAAKQDRQDNNGVKKIGGEWKEHGVDGAETDEIG